VSGRYWGTIAHRLIAVASSRLGWLVRPGAFTRLLTERVWRRAAMLRLDRGWALASAGVSCAAPGLTAICKFGGALKGVALKNCGPRTTDETLRR
jgi:hypothetical protein